MITCNDLNRMLVDNDSSINILFGSAKPFRSLYRFIGEALILIRQIIPAIEIGEEATVFHEYMDFLIMDNRFAYNEILGRSAS